jgi:hypothetical protein
MKNSEKKITAHDATIDHDYTWGPPVTAYQSNSRHMRLLLAKSRLDISAQAALFALQQPRSWC